MLIPPHTKKIILIILVMVASYVTLISIIQHSKHLAQETPLRADSQNGAK
jgi:hypothetical protein